MCLRSVTCIEQVAGAGLRKGLLWERGGGGCSWGACSSPIWVLLAGSPGGGRLSQTRQCWPLGRDFLGLVSRHSQGQHAVTSWDLGVVVLGPRGAVSISHSLLSCLDRAWPAVTSPFYHEMVPRGDGNGPGTGFGHGVQAVNDSPTFTFDGPQKGHQSYFLTC